MRLEAKTYNISETSPEEDLAISQYISELRRIFREEVAKTVEIEEDLWARLKPILESLRAIQSIDEKVLKDILTADEPNLRLDFRRGIPRINKILEPRSKLTIERTQKLSNKQIHFIQLCYNCPELLHIHKRLGDVPKDRFNRKELEVLMQLHYKTFGKSIAGIREATGRSQIEFDELVEELNRKLAYSKLAITIHNGRAYLSSSKDRFIVPELPYRNF